MHIQQLNPIHQQESPIPNSASGSTAQVSRKVQWEKLQAAIKETEVVPKIKGFNEIAGLEDVKATLERLLILPKKQPQLYSNLKSCNTILFYGPPGTGKTKIVHALAAEAKVTLHCVGASTILSSFVGPTEKMLHELFQYMKKSQETKILFIDEIDSLCRHRSANELEHTRRLKTELMTQLSDFEEHRNAFFICATNCPWDLDPAFTRRFQERIYIPLPHYDQRHSLLKLFTKETSLEDTSQNWEPILQSTEGFSGSDLNMLVQHALRLPIKRLQRTKVWQKVDGKYKPFNSNWSPDLVICNIADLPANSVMMTRADQLDLLDALNMVSRTVSKADNQRYDIYRQINLQ